ncbi:hypothetical protein D7147_03805 [Micromonospora musae]|uniref:Uncharacterized protein n=1 Tax=Micromonospora musae TaxID=1894970 RepID=A0A3A9XTV5_9ACTN|nr:hypothetical protein [Micromonospora musae]RKN24129.1 hypothetical protein D7147_03805 [Micromonospora musae]RKN28638.1 hypothetical protein D7044_25810 [Micromonospora musae]
MTVQDPWWTSLASQVREQIDEQLRQRRLIHAVVLLRSADGLDPRPGLYEAQDMLAERLAWLRSEGLVEPDAPPVEVPRLREKVMAMTDPVVAVEALWDGDTQGWFVRLYAITQRPSPHHPRFDEQPLAGFRHGSDLRLFSGEVPPWPEAAEATEKGRALADNIGVPFYFASPDVPDDDLPRWWDLQADPPT